MIRCSPTPAGFREYPRHTGHKMRVIIQPSFNGREMFAALQAGRSLKVETKFVRDPDSARPDDVAIGDVPYCEAVLAAQGVSRPEPDFYPEFLYDWMRRWAFKVRYAATVTQPVFVKSATGYKDYPACVLNTGDTLPPGMNWVCEPVKFTQEWRYYVSDGDVVATGWYDGSDENEPAPSLAIEWPKSFCGAVDFGRLDNGNMALIESQHPFACGWYGDDPELFLLWQIRGWEFMRAVANLV